MDSFLDYSYSKVQDRLWNPASGDGANIVETSAQVPALFSGHTGREAELADHQLDAFPSKQFRVSQFSPLHMSPYGFGADLFPWQTSRAPTSSSWQLDPTELPEEEAQIFGPPNLHSDSTTDSSSGNINADLAGPPYSEDDVATHPYSSWRVPPSGIMDEVSTVQSQIAAEHLENLAPLPSVYVDGTISSAIAAKGSDVLCDTGLGPSQILQPRNSANASSASSFLTEEDRWEAILSRNSDAEGQFVYCVKTTKIYCRPTCASRRPSRSNVLFATTVADAEAMHFRPCKRCRPTDSVDPASKRQNDAVERLKLALVNDSAETKITVKSVAEEMGVSMWHLNRTFKRKVGAPPQQWAQEIKRAKYHVNVSGRE